MSKVRIHFAAIQLDAGVDYAGITLAVRPQEITHTITRYYCAADERHHRRPLVRVELETQMIKRIGRAGVLVEYDGKQFPVHVSQVMDCEVAG
jgi:hypothetical protein